MRLSYIIRVPNLNRKKLNPYRKTVVFVCLSVNILTLNLEILTQCIKSMAMNVFMLSGSFAKIQIFFYCKLKIHKFGMLAAFVTRRVKLRN